MTGGALCLDSRKTYTFGDKDLKILSQFAELAGKHLARAREVETSLVEHRFYQSLRSISTLHKTYPKWTAFRSEFLKQLSLATGFSHCILTVRDESGRSYYLEGASENPLPGSREGSLRFPMGQGLVGWVFKNQTPVYSGEVDEAGANRLPLFGLDVPSPDFKSVICLPVHFSKKTRGVLTLADEKYQPVTEELKAFVAMPWTGPCGTAWRDTALWRSSMRPSLTGAS